MSDMNLATVIKYLSPDHYARLNVIAQKYAIPDAIQLFYRDRINQALGRNQGLRADPNDPNRHVVYVSKNLYNELGAGFFTNGRYPLHLVKS